MERYKKRDMLQNVAALTKINDTIVRAAAADAAVAAQALVECQETALVLGTYIETLDEKYAGLVTILEDYCENIYQMSEALSDEKQCRKIGKKIQKQLAQLENGIRYELPEDKKEVVFLPYAASMWDSLESVWMAADADENTDAYVIPIPYFDKNPDGSFREEHYEGGLYPDYVPITRYDEYDFENRRPDVIFIHAPYDECNHVTSIHPFFYAKNIRNFTDMLVYIPYFVLREIEPDDQIAVDKMKHFCFLPGIIYADRVIVQSEKMRKIYINEYSKAAKEMGLSGEHVDRAFLGQKILGIGSPKFDKVLAARKEVMEIPPEWLKVIQKPDGSFKKIVFYNTSINALLHNDERMFAKMENVFSIFRERSEEITLLWRPHPLIEGTLTSMRPALWEQYKAIRDHYISEGFGIYDDTADMDRAVALSDAYYGDASSIVHLYKATGKPVMMQNADVIWKENNVVMDSLNWELIGDKAWFVNVAYNVLFWVDINTGVCEFETRIPNESGGLYWKNPKCVVCGDDIFCIPGTAECIWVYQRQAKKFLKINVDNPDHTECLMFWFCRYDNKLFAVSAGLKKIFEVNVDTKKAENVYSLEMDEKWPNIMIDGTKIYSLLSTSNRLICFNVVNCESVVYDLPDIGKSFYTVCFDGERFWLSGWCKEIYIWRPGDTAIETVIGLPKNFGIYDADGENILNCETEIYDVQVFNESVLIGEYVWFIPYQTNQIIYVNCNTFEIRALEIVDEVETRQSILSRNWAEGKYRIQYVREKRYIGLFSFKNRCIYEIDADEKTVKKCSFSYSDSCLENYKHALWNERYEILERNEINIGNYLDGMMKDTVAKNEKNDRNAGVDIYKLLAAN